MRRVYMLGVVGLLFLCSLSASPLCTSFSVGAAGGTFTQSGLVCNAGDLQIFNLQYTWLNPFGNPDPGLISINVDTSNSKAPVLTVTAANNWTADVGTESDFSLTYTWQQNGGQNIVNTTVSADTNVGWDPLTDPNLGGLTGEATVTTVLTPGVGPGGMLGLTFIPPAPDGTCPPGLPNVPCHMTASSSSGNFSPWQIAVKTQISVGLFGGDNPLDIARLNSLSQTASEDTVPEPATTVLVGLGLVASALTLRKRLPRRR